MTNSPRPSGRWTPACSPVVEEQGEGRRGGSRPFDGATLGFWLGAVALGAAGGVFGACMSSGHPLAVGFSVLWWGIYLGCLGASLGALLGSFASRCLAGRFQGGKDPGAAAPLSTHSPNGRTSLWQAGNARQPVPR
jgi:hypothetical protein